MNHSGNRFSYTRWSLPFLGLVLVWIMLFEHLGGYDLSAPDEPHYGLVAREMLTENRWLLPHRNDKPYPDKPPLFFWSIAAASFITGGEVTAFSARLPSALASLWVLWILWRFARSSGDEDETELAPLALLTMLTTALFFYQARMAQIDMLLCCLTTSAAYFGYLLLSGQVDSARRAAMTRNLGLCLGFAILAKGPVGYLVPLGAMGLFAAFNARDTWRRFPVKALLWGLVPPLAWIVLLVAEVALTNQWDYLFNLLYKQTVVRYLNPWHHYQPPYYFLQTMALDFMPWLYVLVAAIPWSRAARAALDNRQRFAWAMVLFTLVFFSLSKGKRNLYILPLYPFAAYLVAVRVRALIADPRLRPLPSLFLPALLLAIIFGGFAFIGFGGLPHLPAKTLAKLPAFVSDSLPANAFALLGASGLAAAIGGMIQALRGRARQAFAGLLIGMILINLTTYQVVLPWIGPHRSARQFTEKAMAILDRQPQRPTVGMVRYRSAYRFFGTYPLVELSSEDNDPPGLPKLADFWKEHPDGWVILRRPHLEAYQTNHAEHIDIHLEVYVGRGEEMVLVTRAP